MKSHATTGGTDDAARAFRGFEHLTANYVYCPNQFFDVCLPHYSRGVIRLVAFLLRQTLGWLDADGLPIQQEISVSYSDLIRKAGISRGAARGVIEDAISAGFITCSRTGRPNSSGHSAATARYALRWDTSQRYVTDPSAFKGFFAGEGYRSPIPNAFFDQVIPRETLAVVKVVGTVLRHTVGYHNQFGRRQQAPLSYSYMQRSANLSHRPTLAAALRHAIDRGYIRRVLVGKFDSTGAGESCPTVYAVRWLHDAEGEGNGSKPEPVSAKRFKNRTDNGSKPAPARRFKNRTDRKTKKKYTAKQRQSVAAAFSLLTEAGFDDQVAERLAETKSLVEIKQQIAWLPLRNPRKNRLGLLRNAIEDNWAEPAGIAAERQQAARQRQYKVRQRQDEAEHVAALDRKNKRRQRLEKIRSQFLVLPEQERRACIELAISEATSSIQSNRIRRLGIEQHVSNDVLEVFAREHQLA